MAGAPSTAANPQRSFRRPGSGYVLWEAIGQNRLGRRYVYVTDGGHWENLGLVELLRRGCGQTLCFDAAGDDLDHFHTLSEAIELARSDLGVEIRVRLKDLQPDPKDENFSPRPYAEGWFRYPNGTMGLLLFAKAAITHSSPKSDTSAKHAPPGTIRGRGRRSHSPRGTAIISS